MEHMTIWPKILLQNNWEEDSVVGIRINTPMDKNRGFRNRFQIVWGDGDAESYKIISH